MFVSLGVLSHAGYQKFMTLQNLLHCKLCGFYEFPHGCITDREGVVCVCRGLRGGVTWRWDGIAHFCMLVRAKQRPLFMVLNEETRSLAKGSEYH